jgi:hypothetical protein
MDKNLQNSFENPLNQTALLKEKKNASTCLLRIFQEKSSFPSFRERAKRFRPIHPRVQSNHTHGPAGSFTARKAKP